uniref:Uncharacterized protein n=1 Tax=Anguilla anguilla TaxID=7936 RepID=A0A0E9RS96_ANGAN
MGRQCNHIDTCNYNTCTQTHTRTYMYLSRAVRSGCVRQEGDGVSERPIALMVSF